MPGKKYLARRAEAKANTLRPRSEGNNERAIAQCIGRTIVSIDHADKDYTRILNFDDGSRFVMHKNGTYRWDSAPVEAHPTAEEK